MTVNPDIDLDTKVAFLSQPRHYCRPTCPTDVEVVQTHMSWVFLTDREVYKMKKPVRFSFLDFSTLDARRRDCEEEVRLNRRLAPEIYLGSPALCLNENGELQLDQGGTPVEWLVRMRRLPAECMLDHAIETGTVDEEQVRRFTRVLTDFYQRTPPEAMGVEYYLERYRKDIQANRRELAGIDGHLPHALVERITDAQLDFVHRSRTLLRYRVEAQRIIEAHGDLRPQHVCLIPTPVFIDCLEFNREFRLLDPVDELAFLAMECEHAGAAFIGPVMFETYRQALDDDPSERLIAFYQAYRATLRAKLAIWHLKDHGDSEHPRWIEQGRSYLELALQYSKSL